VGSRLAARLAGSHEAVAAIKKNTTTMVRKVRGSVALIPTSIEAISRVTAKAAKQAAADADGRQAKSLAHNELENVAGLSAQSHTNADFRGALSYHGRKDAVESDAREERRDYRERPNEE
jgi:hypothetical protein